ncbi:hypothetical protein [Aeromonas molluscorum]|uniref:Uncharacterized protein n=1 Tax=Aeromonas molluscorum 848 TaxID=1268236 RepID=R1H536_9GAMM|nr:hypothetical protein [Aeromonas molluscorum]EOD53609.1 hypothetical protein G113_18679 [Aeromonas molluscorum 848]
MTVRVKSKLEKIGSGTGLLMGIIAFNLLAPLLFEKREGFDVIQMVAAIACAMLCSALNWAPVWADWSMSGASPKTDILTAGLLARCHVDACAACFVTAVPLVSLKPRRLCR